MTTRILLAKSLQTVSLYEVSLTGGEMETLIGEHATHVNSLSLGP